MIAKDEPKPSPMVRERKPRVLYVDHKADQIALLSRRFTMAGYELMAAVSGPEAIAALEEFQPDLVIVDVRTPLVSGLDILSHTQQLSGGTIRIPVIMVSVDAEVADRVEAISAGAADFISKPYDVEELLARVEAQLRIEELQQKMLEAERLKAVFEMAGAACHELSQPLTALIGYTQILLRKKDKDDPELELLENLHRSAQRASDVIRKIQNVERYEVKAYSDFFSIIDLDRAGQQNDPTQPE